MVRTSLRLPCRKWCAGTVIWGRQRPGKAGSISCVSASWLLLPLFQTQNKITNKKPFNKQQERKRKGTTSESLLLPRALNLSCLSSERSSCFSSSNPCHAEWARWVTTGLANDRRQQTGDNFLNPSSWASAELRVGIWAYLQQFCRTSPILDI